MSPLVTSIDLDLVPLRDIAAWQAGLNLAATTGRSLGGPVGGWLADTMGWRWSFAGQAPIFLVAAAIGWILLPRGPPRGIGVDQAEITEDHHAEVPTAGLEGDDKTAGSSLSRIDFLGAALLALTVLSVLIPIDLAGKSYPWTHPLILSLFTLSLLFGGLFLSVESWWATNPVFPLSLFRDRNVVASYAITCCQMAAQLGLMFSVPIYFQVSQRVSNARAGAYLFPAVFGNAVGSVVAGLLIRRYARPRDISVINTNNVQDWPLQAHPSIREPSSFPLVPPPLLHMAREHYLMGSPVHCTQWFRHWNRPDGSFHLHPGVYQQEAEGACLGGDVLDDAAWPYRRHGIGCNDSHGDGKVEAGRPTPRLGSGVGRSIRGAYGDTQPPTTTKANSDSMVDRSEGSVGHRLS